MIYDAADDRFIMSWLGFDYPGQKGPTDGGDSWCDVAVSATNDPRGTTTWEMRAARCADAPLHGPIPAGGSQL